MSTSKTRILERAAKQENTSKSQSDSGRDLTLGRTGLNEPTLLTNMIKWILWSLH